MTTGESKRLRDYSHEYQLRSRGHKRMAADVEKETAEALRDYLEARGLTFTKWLDNKIREDLGQ